MLKIFGKKISKKSFFITLFVILAFAIGAFFGFDIFKQTVLNRIDLSDVAVLGNIGNDINKFSNDVNSNISSNTYDDDMSVHFLSVGKADCAYIHCKDVNILIDAADKDANNFVVEYLKRQNLEKLDMVVMSHPHRDHIGQMASVIKEFEVDKFIDVDLPKSIIPTTWTYEKMLKALIDKQIPVESVSAGKNFELGDLKIDILGPVRINRDNMNDNSIVMKVTYKDVSFLFTGDATKTEENDIIKHYGLYNSKRKKMNKLKNEANLQNVLKADVLKVGHHGSNSSSTERFLKLVKPEYAVVSTASRESMGLPPGWRWDALERLQECCDKVYKTYESGNVIFLTDGKDIKVETEK